MKTLMRPWSIVLSALLLMIGVPSATAAPAAVPSPITIAKVEVDGSAATIQWSQKNAPAKRVYRVEIKNVTAAKPSTVVLDSKSNSLQYEKLIPGNKYEVRVRLTSGKYFYPWSSKKVFTASSGAPTGLVLANVTDVSAEIKWSALSKASSYRVYVNGEVVGTTSDSFYAITNLKNNATYKVWVTGIIGKVESASSKAIAVKTKSAATSGTTPQVADSITSRTISEITTSSARITWATPSSPKGFTLRIYDSGGSNLLNTYDLAGQIRTYVIPSLSINSTYQFTLTRTNENGTTFTTPLTTLTTLKNPVFSLVSAPTSTSSLTLTWAPVPGAVVYEIFRDGSTTATKVDGSATSLLVSELRAGYVYSFTIRVTSTDATKNLVVSDLTSPVTGSPLTDAAWAPLNTSAPVIQLPYASAPIVGAVLTASPGVWRDQAQVTSFSYQWQRSIDGGSSWADISGQTNTTYTVVSADYQHRLRVSVSARNNNGAVVANSATSNSVDALFNVQIPVIRGFLIPGQVLEVNEGTWSSKLPMTFTYQWVNSSSGNIAGEQTPTYTLQNSDIGANITVRVTGVTSLGSLVVTSAVRSAVTAIANTEVPVVTGVAKTYSTLSTTIGTWIGSPTGTQYQWQKSADKVTWDSIPGATDSSYTIALTDAGFFLRSGVIETKTVSSVTYKVVASSIPTELVTSLTITNSVLPAISGSWNTGQTLNLSNGVWSVTGTFTYQWQTSSNGSTWTDLAGATSSSYTLTNAEAGLYMRARVTNVSGSATGFAFANATPKVGAPHNSAAPTTSGTMQVGETLTVAAGTWSGSPTLTYQWQSSTDSIAWSAIAGATSSTFVMTFALSNSRIRTVVTAVNAVDTATATTGIISGFSPPRATVVPVISGTTTVGQTLSSTTGTWPSTASGYSYQWQESADAGTTWTNISGAVANTYSLIAGDTGYAIRVQVSLTNTTGTSAAYSLPTAIIAP